MKKDLRESYVVTKCQVYGVWECSREKHKQKRRNETDDSLGFNNM